MEVRGAILDEEARRKASGKSSNSANITRGRAATKNVPMQRSKSKRKRKEITCFQYGCKGHKKPDCRFYKQKPDSLPKEASKSSSDLLVNFAVPYIHQGQRKGNEMKCDI